MSAGYSNRSCDAMWPECGISAGDLLQSALQILRSGWGTPGHTNSLISAHKMSAPGHGHKMSKRSIAGLPPLITISGDEVACRPCEMIGSFCFIFGIGSYISTWFCSSTTSFLSQEHLSCAPQWRSQPWTLHRSAILWPHQGGSPVLSARWCVSSRAVVPSDFLDFHPSLSVSTETTYQRTIYD